MPGVSPELPETAHEAPSDTQGKYVINGIGRSVHSRTVDTRTSAAPVQNHIQQHVAPVGAVSMLATTLQAPTPAMDTSPEDRNKLEGSHTSTDPIKLQQ